MKIECCMISSLDREWRSLNRERLKQRLRIIGQNIELVTAHCEKQRVVNTNTEYLLGDIFSTIWGKWANYIVQEEIQVDKFEWQNVFKLKIRHKEVIFVTVYRLPDGSGEEVKTVKV